MGGALNWKSGGVRGKMGKKGGRRSQRRKRRFGRGRAASCIPTPYILIQSRFYRKYVKCSTLESDLIKCTMHTGAGGAGEHRSWWWDSLRMSSERSVKKKKKGSKSLEEKHLLLHLGEVWLSVLCNWYNTVSHIQSVHGMKFRNWSLTQLETCWQLTVSWTGSQSTYSCAQPSAGAKY